MSTVTLATDTETPIVVGRRTRQTREKPIEASHLDPGPSRRNAKRARSSGNEGGESNDDDDGDDEYLPRKRAKLTRSATRSFRIVRRSSICISTL